MITYKLKSMPNENLEKIVKSENEKLPTQDHGVVTNNIVLAGLTVKHKLLPHKYLLEGFIVEDIYFNRNNFNVNGNKIHYKPINQPGSMAKIDKEGFAAINNLIYSKLIVDGKKSNFSDYFKRSDEFVARVAEYYSGYGIYKRDEIYWTVRLNYTNWKYGLEFEYYLYDTTTSNLPECAANKVYALCKHYEEGEFKYSIFNLHEIIPE